MKSYKVYSSVYCGIKLGRNNRRKCGDPNIWKASTILQSNAWVKKEVMRTIRKYFKLIENKNETYHVMGVANARLRGKFMVLNIHTRQEQRSQINKQCFHLKKLDKRKAK